MTELQEKILELLCEVDAICEKHHIEYALYAGTALGAERHQGFVPWDDDADIVMTLENYEKFLRVAPKELGKNRALNSLESKPGEYPFTYARYVNTETTAIQRHTAFGGCDPGVKVDIFFVVPVEGTMEDAKHKVLETLAFSETIAPYGLLHAHRPKAFHEIYEKEVRKCKLLGRSFYVRHRLRKLKKKVKKADYYILFTGMLCNSFIFEGDLFNQIKYVDFEKTQLRVLEMNLDLLDVIFGATWKNLPPIIDQPKHVMLLDLNRPYNDYLDVLWKQLPLKETSEIAAKRRENHLYERKHFDEVMDNNQRLRNLIIELSVTKAYHANRKQDVKVLEDIFSVYYEKQLSGINKARNMVISLDEDVFVAAMHTAIAVGRYAEAYDIIQHCIAAGAWSAEQEEEFRLLEKALICKRLWTAVYTGESRQNIEQQLGLISYEEVKQSLTVQVIRCYLDVLSHGEDSTYEQVIDKLDEMISIFGNKDELLYFKGHCFEVLHKQTEAEFAYAKAFENAKNGIIFQKLLEKGFNIDGK